jgi:hypothetical protein
VKASGVTAIGSYTYNGQNLWQITNGTKYWNLDLDANGGSGAFISASSDIATAVSPWA